RSHGMWPSRAKEMANTIAMAMSRPSATACMLRRFRSRSKSAGVTAPRVRFRGANVERTISPIMPCGTGSAGHGIIATMHMLARLSLKNRALIALVTIVASAFGFIGVGALKQELMPSVQFPAVVVITSYPGASPEVVNNDVSTPIETALRGVT